MKYSDLLETILAKLNLTQAEAQYDNVLTKIPHLCNECLGDVANRGKPLYKLLIIDITKETVSPTTLLPNETVSSERFITFDSDFLALTNEFIQRVPITVTNGVITETTEYERVDGNKFRRLSSRQLLFPNEYEYRYLVPIICRYPRLATSDIAADDELDIELSILELIPNYVVSELLRVDDVGLSTSYRNSYESSLAALNDSVLEAAGSLYSERW